MTARGSDNEDRYPEVRAGVAYGDVVSRLGDVFGPTVNIAARLTSVARPGSRAGRPGRPRRADRRRDRGEDPDEREHGGVLASAGCDARR